MKRRYSVILGIVLLISCSHSSENSFQVETPRQSIYNIELLYINESVDSVKHNFSKKPTKENLHLFFDTWFEHDTLLLFINNHLHTQSVLNTNPSTGNATYMDLKGIDTLNSVSFRINNGRLCYLEIDKEKNVIIITFMNQLLKVVFDDKIKIYD